MTQVAGTTLCRKIPGGIPEFGVLSFPGIQQILYVEADSTNAVEDGTIQAPFHTIQAAVTAANALTPAIGNRILILIYPGIYDEQVTLADDYVYLAGIDQDSCILTNAATPLTVTADETAVWTLAIRVTGADTIADISGDASFYECLFESTNNSDSSRIEVLAAADVLFKDCQLIHGFSGRMILRSQAAGNIVRLDGCQVAGYLDPLIGSLFITDCDITSSLAARTIRLGASNVDVTIRGSRIANTAGDVILFIGNPSGDVVILSNEFEAAAGFCLDASAAVTGITIDNNVMIGGGIDEDISHIKPERIVGASGMKDWYATTQEALTSCTFDDIVVKLLVDEALGAQLTVPAQTLILDGQGKHSLTRTGATAAAVTTGTDLTLRDIVLTGEWQVTNAAILRLHDVEINGAIRMEANTTAAALLEVIDSEVIGSNAWLWAIRIRDADPTIILKRSRLKGKVGQVALYWDSGATNDNVQIQDCAIMHGSLGANNPFGRNAAQTPDYRSTHTIYNLDPETGAIWTNLVAVGQRFDAFDVNGDY